MSKALSYQDVWLKPNKSIVSSRKKCLTNRNMYDFYFDLPVMPANMPPVVNLATYEKYVNLGLPAVMHRFDIDPIEFLENVRHNWKCISVGVKQADIDIITFLKKCDKGMQPDCICIDIAHGHCYEMGQMISHIKQCAPYAIIIAGNVTTQEAVIDLQDWGADVIKVGIGPGHVCSTKNKTGFHVPMFTAVKECAAVSQVPIIADGGIRENGDIVKALVAGADFVMIGGMFAACTDSPAAIVDGKKEYYGSASIRNKGSNNNVEGFTTHLTPTMTIAEKVKEIKEDLQSAISYAGGDDLSCLNLSQVQFYTRN